MRERIGRRLGATSVVALLVLAGLFIGGVSIAWAAITLSPHTAIQTGLTGQPSQWNPTAPGPSGVAYNADHDTMFVVDTDRNNYMPFDGVDLWEITLSGAVVRTGVLPTQEPTGVAYDPVTNRLFVTTDSPNRVYVINIGPDASFGTADDGATNSVATSGWGSGDTEDPAYDPVTGDVFFLNGDGPPPELYRMNPTTLTQVGSAISLAGLGPDNFEGLAMTPDGNLLAGAEDGSGIYLITPTGGLIQMIDVPNNIGLDRISGLGISQPGAGTGAYDVWIADRQNTGSSMGDAENDGMVFRLTTDGTPPATTTTPPTTPTTIPDTTTTPTTPTTIPGGTTTTTTTPPPPPPPPTATTAVSQTNSGLWKLYRGPIQAAQFYFGNPGDYGFMGDWDGDGIDTPGLYRRSDGYVYLRNSNTQGVADIAFFFGNPGDLPLAGDFDGDGRDTVSIYRPSEGKFYIMNHLGVGDAGLGAADYSYYFGNPGDAPFMGDWNSDGIDTPGLRRNSDGFVYLRHSNTQGVGEVVYFYGNSGDVVFTGDWDRDGDDTLGLYRPSNGTIYLRNTNTTGSADSTFVVGGGMQPAGGKF